MITARRVGDDLRRELPLLFSAADTEGALWASKTALRQKIGRYLTLIAQRQLSALFMFISASGGAAS